MGAILKAFVMGALCAIVVTGTNVLAAADAKPAADSTPPAQSQSPLPPSGKTLKEERDAACTAPKLACEAPQISSCQNGKWVCIGPAQPD